MYAWEVPFQKIVQNTRLAEMKKIRYAALVKSLFFASIVYLERVSLFMTIVLFVLSGGQLTAEIAFVLAPFFNILQLSTSILFPNAMLFLSETTVSIKRIQVTRAMRKKTTIIKKFLANCLLPVSGISFVGWKNFQRQQKIYRWSRNRQRRVIDAREKEGKKITASRSSGTQTPPGLG